MDMCEEGRIEDMCEERGIEHGWTCVIGGRN